MRAARRILLALALPTLVMCGVKGPPRPPAAAVEAADAGTPDGGAP